jgi:transposase
MSRRARRNHTPAFKAKVALAAVKGDRTTSGVFGLGGAAPAAPAIDVKSLHAKIGELTLENDFLE